ncbi:MAG: hypothetical protein Q9216_001767 [Gyalolechia sp. 2 TL-2023]
MVTYYHVLGLTPQASQQEIREAYQRISTQASNNDNSQIDRMLVNEAYGTLSTPENQRVYDEWLQDSKPLGNQSLAFLSTEIDSTEAAGRRVLRATTPSPPQYLSTVSSPGQSPPKQEDRKATSTREELRSQRDDERVRREMIVGGGRQSGTGSLEDEHMDVDEAKAKGKGKK